MLKYVLSRLRMLCALAASLVGCYQILGFFESKADSVRVRQAADLARQVALDLPLPEEHPRLIVAPFQGDDARLLDAKCRDWLARRNVRMEYPAAWERLSSVLRADSDVSDAATAVEQYGGGFPDGYAVLGEVVEWITYPERDARLTTRVQLVSLEQGEVLFDQVFRVPEEAELPVVAQLLVDPAASNDASWNWRSLIWGLSGWLVLVFLTPWVFAGLIGSMLARKSNLVNAALLAVLVLLSTAVAWFSWGRGCNCDTGPIAVVLASVLSIPYFGYACGQLNSLRS